MFRTYLLILALASLFNVVLAQDLTQGAFCNERPLRVGIKVAKPFTFVDENGNWQGVSVYLWQKIAHKLGCPEEGRDYVYVEFGTDLTSMLESVTEGKVDVVIGALTITSERETNFDFGQSFYTTYLGMATKDSDLGTWTILRLYSQTFLSPIFLKLLLVLLASLVILGFLMWLFEHRVNEAFQGKFGFLLGTWWATETVTTVGYGDMVPKTLKGRLLATMAMFLSVTFFGLIFSLIISIMSIDLSKGKIESFDDLPHVRVITVQNSSSSAYLEREAISFQYCKDLDDCLNKIATDQADVFVYDLPLLKHFMLSNDRLQNEIKLLKETFYEQWYSFGFPKNSELREFVNRILPEEVSSSAWKNLLASYFEENK